MGQVNVTYDDGLLRRLDSLAEELGVSRPDLLRSIAEEAAKAREQGRAMFEPAEQPLTPEAALSLVHELKELSTYLDRLVRSADKREQQLLKSCQATEEANRSARERLGNELSEKFREGATPYANMLAGVRDRIDAKLEAVLAATREPESLNAIRSDLAAMKTSLRRSRRQLHFHFGRDWKLASWEVGMLTGFGLMALVVVQILLATILPHSWVATPLSLRLFGSADVGICELYAHSRHLDRCPVLTPVKTGGKR